MIKVQISSLEIYILNLESKDVKEENMNLVFVACPKLQVLFLLQFRRFLTQLVLGHLYLKSSNVIPLHFISYILEVMF